MRQLIFIFSILILLSACTFTKRVKWISLKRIHSDKTISLQSDDDSGFYMQFDRAAYLKFIENDTSIRKAMPDIKAILESNERNLDLDTVFSRISRLIKTGNFNSGILYEDFIYRQLNKGNVIIVNKNNRRKRKFIRRTTYYYDHEELRSAYFYGKTIFYGAQFMIVDF
ncbi:MAG: hypothetical protein JWP12_967 [Bacteroidetes bacterium]|nr:hypothetical protein [Bacteroidota bacterium]